MTFLTPFNLGQMIQVVQMPEKLLILLTTTDIEKTKS